MEQGVLALLADAGIRVTFGRRGYRPSLSLAGFETKILKPQNIVEMLHLGSRDIGFAGADWVAELSAELVELLDTGLDPVAVVAAATPEFDGRRPRAGAVRRRLGIRAPDPGLARAPRAARDLRPFLWRDRGVPARGCRLHRRQHGDRRDAQGQRPGDRRRADALLDPALRPPAGARAAGQARAHRDAGAAAALGARCARAGDARGQRRGRVPGGGDRGAALDARADHGAAARRPGLRAQGRGAAQGPAAGDPGDQGAAAAPTSWSPRSPRSCPEAPTR